MRKIVIVCGLALIVAAMIVSPAAIGQTYPRGSVPQQRQERLDQRAEIIKERIEIVIARFNNNKARHVASYNAVKDKITEIVQTMSAKGYDTSKLASDLQAWDAMVVKTAGDYATFISLLQTAEQYAPFASQGQFVSAMNQARAQLRVVRQDSLDARHMYQTVIRPDVQALASQTPKTPSTTP
ncbi:MAG: hypothetical protein ACYC99_13720 [Candidatus Geothermincolia bacterium]